MALPSWPATVPNSPLRSSVRVSRPFIAPDVTEFEAGNTRDRARGTVQYRIVEQTIRMSDTEFAAFDNFVEDDLVMGTLRFTMNVWNGLQMELKTVKLSGTEKFTTAPRGRALAVSMRLEVEL
ncbi:MAG: hypothetical protein K5905_12060 [Roseibium sp.]|uniref:hypothetical protein n=1 Tax=Roseibium sp. TaxID=1936156 RepID=UPI00262A4ED1|nr:hypothetical protein [Roseibium sp.]MCV0426201.1 hypothetical protein [Roseibium sp.]